MEHTASLLNSILTIYLTNPEQDVITVHFKGAASYVFNYLPYSYWLVVWVEVSPGLLIYRIRCWYAYVFLVCDDNGDDIVELYGHFHHVDKQGSFRKVSSDYIWGQICSKGSSNLYYDARPFS